MSYQKRTPVEENQEEIIKAVTTVSFENSREVPQKSFHETRWVTSGEVMEYLAEFSDRRWSPHSVRYYLNSLVKREKLVAKQELKRFTLHYSLP